MACDPEASVLGAEVRSMADPPTIAAPRLDLAEDGYRLVADTDRAVLFLEEVGVFAVEEGRRVGVRPDEGVEPGLVRAFLHSTISAILLAQRGQFALHANAVRVGGAPILIAGHRGAGKSTTSIRLLQRGHELLCDDMCLLHTEDGGVRLEPTARGLRVSPASARALGLDISAARLPFPGSDKVVLPFPAAAPQRAAAIVVLEQGDGALESRAMTGAAAARLVLEHAYRGDLLRPLLAAEIFEWALAVAAALPVVVITRPRDGWTVEAVADAVEAVAAPLQ